MIKNFLTVAFRNFLRQRFYSVINIIGLATGLTCALFILLWVKDEVDTDRFHEHDRRLFRVVANFRLPDGEVITWTITPGPLAENIRENDPEVEWAVRTQSAGDHLMQYGEKRMMERGFFADHDFFKLFTFEVLRGKISEDQNDISQISISRRLAQKLFGDADPIGQTVTVDTKRAFTVQAVFEDPPHHSSLRFDFILPFEVFKKQRGENFNWDNYDHPLYLALHDPSQAEALVQKISDRVALTRETSDDEKVEFYLQPFGEQYLHGKFVNGRPSGGRIEYVKIFSLVAVFIIIIACINFTNMATARAVNRAKEVGIRKVVGAQRKSLILQFLAESMLITATGMFVAIAVVFMTLPFFNALVGKQIELYLNDSTLIGSMVFIILITGLFAGFYPAIVLSGYQPARVMKGNAGQHGKPWLRKALVVFQFTLTVVLIVSSLVIYKQIRFIMDKDLGYQKQGVMAFGGARGLFDKFETFRQETGQHPAIQSVSRSNESLVEVQNQNSSVDWPGRPEDTHPFFRTVIVDYGFLETMGLNLKEGRFFSERHNDTSNFVLSSRAVQVMGLDNPIGTTISQWNMKGTVVGVVDDLHVRSMHETIDPVVFMCKPEWTRQVFVRFDESKAQDVIAHVGDVYKKYNPEYPFSYTLVDQQFENLYKNESIIGSLALGFTFMAVVISGLGLIGLAAYTSEQRKKEISIRRTLGASVAGIVGMMSRDFIKLSIVAILIGCPLAWIATEKFLSGYAYRTALEWEVFVFASVIILVISLSMVIFQVVKAALANPVDSLRNE